MINNKNDFKRVYQEKFESLSGKALEEGTDYDKYKALASMVKDRIISNWISTNNHYLQDDLRQVYYFSIEFLPGKFLARNLLYMGLSDIAKEALAELGIDLETIEAQEPDAGLGNGGLGRLGACFLDSLASLGLPGHGCSIRYKYGLFKQKILDGYQVELPDDWLSNGNAWEIKKSDKAVEVRFGGNVRINNFFGRNIFVHENYERIRAVPYDIPILGYDNKIVNNLRLWSAEVYNKDFDFSTFNRGDYLKAVEYKYSVESISQILYPDDSYQEGKLLRLKQQYFLCSAGLQSIIRRYKQKHGGMEAFADRVALHINDTHPALCIPELMRVLIDEQGMSWDDAWRITTNCISYTNHTILPEALEKWPIEEFKALLPRIYMIIEEINNRFCQELWNRYSSEPQRVREMAILADGYVRMVNLAVVGSYRVNGVARVHSEILKNHLLKYFSELYPEKFNNKTNGVTHRRFLLKANPSLSQLINETIGTRWIKDGAALLELKAYAEDASFRDKLNSIKRYNKELLTGKIREKYDIQLNPDSIFDVHVKRIHAYKRQLLNILHIIDLYNRLKENPGLDVVPRTFIFGGKSAPNYYIAKKIIKLITTVSQIINNDQDIRQKIKIIFLENYNVSLSERIFPATDISEQISTASKEASGTGNMKFMMNGAITLGTLDGANIEIFEEVGAENMITFGLSVDQVLNFYVNGGYSAWDQYNSDQRIQNILNQIDRGFFITSAEEFKPIYNSLLNDNDEFFVLKDFSSYVEAQNKVDTYYRDKNKWAKMSICNIAHSGRFYSDRTINEYAEDIWRIKPVKI